MKDYLVKGIPPNSFFTKAVLLDKAFILTAPEMPFTPEMSEILEKWSFSTVYSEGDQSSASDASAAADDGGASLTQQSDSEKMEKATEFYKGLLAYTEIMFTKAAVSGDLDYKDITDRIKDMVEYVKEDRRFLMRVLKNVEPAPSKTYLASHSVRSTIISIIIGTYLKLPNHRLLELAIAALIHEVGMLKLPTAIFMNDRPLNDSEKKAIVTHPVLGYSMLKSLDFPLPICLAALEHHERENGGGYPRRLSSEKISLYSKIIAVACSYEALSSKRPHKEEKDGYTGMLELLKNEGKQYDDTVVKALVLSLSIYPIGLYVLLSNNKKGQVIDVNPENPRFPIVQIFGETSPDGRIITMQTTQDGLNIVRPLTRAEIDV
ncbi:MAG: HD-GYP domain-containing protein [Treponema sp.]|jgi:HD-GYP domain-containing protein (c-di-GMP phosphodiesterase class II)|nr:HD-GYP domain-containing protein [Treponema sp.]